MKLLIIILLFYLSIYSKVAAETEITTEDGIEVFQNEKYYLLKKNVKIKSDNFDLSADNVRISFDKSLYDIVELNAKGNVDFNSSQFKMNGGGESLNFVVKIENIKIEGIGSILITEDIEMFSDGLIEVNNLSGNFSLQGLNSKLINKSIMIRADSIEGAFLKELNQTEINFLEVIDEKLSYVKNNDIEMYAKRIIFNNEKSQIELIEDVTIIRNEEKITGDYGTIDTNDNSYKIKSNNKNKVKVIILNDE